MKPRKLLPLLALAALALSTTAATAASGGVVDGGGSVVNGVVFEKYLHNQKPVDPATIGLDGKAELARFAHQVPRLAEDMATIYQKKWYVVPGKLLRQLDAKGTGIPLATQEVVLQDKDFVFVDQDWLASVKDKPEEKSLLLQHELWQNLRVNFHPEMDPAKVWKINYAVQENPHLSDRQLADLTNKFGFWPRYGRHYGTRHAYELARDYAVKDAAELAPACTKLKGVAQLKALKRTAARMEKREAAILASKDPERYLILSEYDVREGESAQALFRSLPDDDDIGTVSADPLILQIICDYVKKPKLAAPGAAASGVDDEPAPDAAGEGSAR
jgi:hypothetical protein